MGLSLASFALCAAAVEVAARVAVHGRQAQPHTERSFLEYDPDLGWRKAAGARQWLYGEGPPVLFQTNSHGLRGPESSYEKPNHVVRVLLLGDSFTEAGTVAEEDSLRAVLEHRLNEEGCAHHEVLNGGTSGYSTDQEYLFFEKEGYRYEPDVVVLLFFSNDLQGNTVTKKKPWFELEGGRLLVRNVPVPPPPDQLQRRSPDPPPRLTAWHGSHALRLLGERAEHGNPPLDRRLAGLGLVPPPADHPPTRDWLLSYGPDSELTERRWTLTLSLIDSLRASVAAHDAWFVVLYVPASFEIDDGDWQRTRDRWGLEGDGWDPGRIVRRLQAACRARGISFVDPSPALRQAQSGGRRAYLRADPHWTEVGHAVAAEALVAYARVPDTCANRADAGPQPRQPRPRP
jgi:SGNH hydrolase-like domain, acetyltransferase AlgX